MRFTASLAALALVAGVVSACSDQPVSAPELQRVESPLANAGENQVVQSVKGSAMLTIAGEQRTFTFQAQKRADGTVDGELQIVARQVDRISHGRVVCMTVLGSSAWLGVVIEQDNVASTPFSGIFRVVDLPQTPGGSPDLMSLMQIVGPAVPQNYCNARPPVPPLLQTEAGEITVTTPGSNSFTMSTVVPLDMAVFVPCAVGGAGEVVLLSGNLHLLTHFTEDGSGGFHLVDDANPQGLSGTGLTSGDKYQGTGGTRFQLNSGPLPLTQTFVNNFRIIGEGGGNDLLVHHNMHLTVNANGEVTAVVDNFSVECK